MVLHVAWTVANQIAAGIERKGAEERLHAR